MNQKEDFFKNCMECRRKSLKNSLFLEIFYVKIQESLSPGPAGYYSKKKKKILSFCGSPPIGTILCERASGRENSGLFLKVE